MFSQIIKPAPPESSLFKHAYLLPLDFRIDQNRLANLFIRRITAVDYIEEDEGVREEGGGGWEEGEGWREEEYDGRKEDEKKGVEDGRSKTMGRRNVPIKELKDKMW